MGAPVIAEPEAQAPEVTPEAAVETLEAPATETTTSTTAQTAPSESVQPRPVGGVEAYRKMKAEALSGTLPNEPASAAPETPPATPPVETPPVTTEPETPPTTPPAEPPTTVPETPQGEPPAVSKERIRLTGLPDGHLVAAANEIARAEGITFTEAFARVAPKPTTAPGTPAATETPAPQLRSREDVTRDIEAANLELDKAADDQDNLVAGAAKRMREAQKTIDRLRDEMGQIDVANYEAETAREDAARAKFNADVAISKAQAVEYWPEADNPDSELSKRMLELADEYQGKPELADLVSQADAPFRFAKLAAADIGLLPKSMRKTPSATPPVTPPATPSKASTSPTATKPAPVNQRAVGSSTPAPASPASGAARTTEETNPDPLGLEKIRSPHDYHQLKSRLTGQKY